jgi:hypothetical protein
MNLSRAKPTRFSIGTATWVAACWVSGSAFASPIERPVDTAGAAGFVPLSYGVYTQNAALSSGLEVDGYTFLGTAGDRINLVGSTSTPGLDAVLVLRDPGSGAVVSTASCNGHAGFSGAPSLCATVMDVVLDTSGLYTLNVSDAGANNIGAYTLHLDQYPPASNWLGYGYGTPTASNPQTYAIDHLGDSDYFAFNVKAGSQFRFSLATTTASLDAHVEIWDTTGTRIQSTFCNGHGGFSGAASTCNVLLDMTAAADGIYKVGVYDVNWENTGSYQISTTCLFGTCATGIPSPVPELPTPGLLALGLCVGWLKFRAARAQSNWPASAPRG